jgi:hypothetical protein
MKNLFILGILFLMVGCKPEEVFPGSWMILGNWWLVEYKYSNRTEWYKPISETSVEFKKSGGLVYNPDSDLNYFGLFGGGWCNTAKSYNLKKDKLYFDFNEPECIPIINPNTPPFAKVLQLSKDELVIEWWYYTYRFRR